MRFRRILLPVLICLISSHALSKEAARGGSAFIKSLIIPGWGQYQLERKSSALAFLGTDLILIGGMLTLNAYGSSARDDYRSLAAVYAGVAGDHEHDFYVDVGNWMSVDQYNEQRLRDRNYEALYNSASDRWVWDTDAHRSKMENTRIRSDRAFNSVFYLVGGIVLNHIASAIHAGRLSATTPSQKTSALSPRGWTMSVAPSVQTPGLFVTFRHEF